MIDDRPTLDSVRVWQRKAGDPFPSTLLVTTATALHGQWVGECFLLVDNGKVYLNGQRIVGQASASDESMHEQLLIVGHKLLTRMARAALRDGPRAAPDITLSDTFGASSMAELQAACTRTDYAFYLRWIARKANSPILREVITQAL